MEKVKFGSTDSMITPMGVGTYYDFKWIGLAKTLRIKPGKARRVNAIKAALDSGINFIDTAEIYETEPFVAEAIKGKKRDELFIATKVFPLHSYMPDLSLILKMLQSSQSLLYLVRT